MKKVLIVISVIFIVLVSSVFLSTLAAADWSIDKVFHPAVTESYDIEDSFSDVWVSVDTTDIIFAKSNGSGVRIECTEGYKITHAVSLSDGALRIETVDKRRWFEHLTIIPVDFKITVYLPEGEWGALSIDTSTGNTEIPADFSFTSVNARQSTGNFSMLASASEDVKVNTSTGSISLTGVNARNVELEASTGNITVSSLTANSLSMEVSTGEITANDITLSGNLAIETSTGKTDLERVSCKNLSSEGSTGSTTMTSVVASERFEVERSTGDVNLNGCDGGEIYISTDTGNVKGSFLAPKIIFAKTDTGRVDVPKSTEGGRCEIETDTGNIEIYLK